MLEKTFLLITTVLLGLVPAHLGLLPLPRAEQRAKVIPAASALRQEGVLATFETSDPLLYAPKSPVAPADSDALPFRVFLPAIAYHHTSPTASDKPFGPFDFPPSQVSDWPFTASRLGRTLSDLQRADAEGMQILIALTGSRSNYTDRNGCFSLELWKDTLDSANLAAIQPYVDNGTIAGLYAVDEPFDWAGDCGPTYREINELCRYANQRLPGIRCGVNAPPSWLAQGLSQTNYDQLGYLFTQTNFRRTSNWAAWANRQFSDASWFNGPMWLSVNVDIDQPTPSQIRQAGIDLCQSPAAGVLMWKWPIGFDQPGIEEVMSDIARACGW